MIEAVGHEHMQAYFRTLGAMVKPGGRVVIQVRAADGVPRLRLRGASRSPTVHAPAGGAGCACPAPAAPPSACTLIRR